MSKQTEPTPPARQSEDFPKTTTIPDGWVTDCLMDKYNHAAPTEASDRPAARVENVIPVPATGRTNTPVNGKANGKTNGKTVHMEPQADPGDETESLFLRRLDPFPSAWDTNGMGL